MTKKKISIGINIQPGPWGGGNLFGRSLSHYFKSKEWDVSFDLAANDLDIIVLFDPRSDSQSSAYTDKEVCRYLLGSNPRALVVQRINECDERKGTHHVNRILMRASAIADHTVFISHYLADLFAGHGWVRPRSSVILNGADQSIFHTHGHQRWKGKGLLRLVTHHWSSNPMKGMDIYEQLDRLLSQSPYRDQFAFTYVGNVPEDFLFKNSRFYPPTHGQKLAQIIRQHHVYLTGSVNEPAGMHHIEGAMCGLPLLYRQSGALPDYCKGFGIGFTGQTFVPCLEKMFTDYAHWADRIADYPHTAQKMCGDYEQLFERLLGQRDAIIKQRKRSLLIRGALGGWGLARKIKVCAQ